MSRIWLTLPVVVLSCIVQDARAENPLAAAPVERTAEPTSADGPAIHLTGQVSGPDGQPKEGATVVLRAAIGGHQYTGGLRHNRDVLARTTTDREGRFDFGSVPIPPRFDNQIEQLSSGRGGFEVLAWAEGCGLIWTPAPQLENPAPLSLKLSPEAEVTGIVRDPEGKGIAGVRITSHSFTKKAAGISPQGDDDGGLNLTLSEVSLGSVTDGGGRFALRNLPREQRIGIVLEADDRQRLFAYLDTGSRPGPAEIKTEYGDRRSIRVLRSPIEATLEPTRDVVVKVFDHEGSLAEGGAVEAIDEQRHMVGWAEVKQGQCRMEISAAGRVTFLYGADPLQPRLSGSAEAEVKAAGTPLVEIRLPPPLWLSVRVVDVDSGRGVAGVYVRYARLKDGPPNQAVSSLAISGADGTFKLPVAPGKGTLNFSMHPVHGYLPPTFGNLVDRKQALPRTEIEIPANGEIEPVKLTLARGLAFRGIVRDSAGQPVRGATIRGQNTDDPYCQQTTRSDAEGRFVLAGLSPHAAALLSATADAGSATQTVDAEPQHPWNETRWVDAELKLTPGVALFGRVLHGGKPRAGVRMKLSRSLGEDRNRYYPWSEVVTDAEGKYRVAGLMAGDGYSFEVLDPEGLLALDWHHQSPYVQHAPEGRTEVELPDVQLVSRGQSLRGVVVDPRGKPVADITVSASMANGRMLSRPARGPVPWTKTAEDGAFELEGLPDEPVALMAYHANSQGGRIMFPAKARPALNQQDIRIVLDPTLTDEVEDLDAPPKP